MYVGDGSVSRDAGKMRLVAADTPVDWISPSTERTSAHNQKRRDRKDPCMERMPGSGHWRLRTMTTNEPSSHSTTGASIVTGQGPYRVACCGETCLDSGVSCRCLDLPGLISLAKARLGNVSWAGLDCLSLRE